MEPENPIDALTPRLNPDLIGHEQAEHAFLSAWHSGRMPHAWLIGGPRGIGKATLAYRFARFALAAGAGTPSNTLALPPTHPVFRRVASGGHADLLTLAPGMLHPETNKPTQDIVVPQIRRAIDFLLKTAAEGGWRVIIVDEAEAMNRSAANALLKVLEEPPPKCLILLVSNSPGRLLPTIRSRCRLLTVSPLDPANVAALLARFRPALDEVARETLVHLAGGSIGYALDLADRGGVELHRELEAILGALPVLNVPAAHGFADKLARPGQDASSGFRTAFELIAAWILQRLGAGGGVAEPWIEAWDQVRRLSGATEGLNLDRKQALLVAFLALQRAARHARRAQSAA